MSLTSNRPSGPNAENKPGSGRAQSAPTSANAKTAATRQSATAAGEDHPSQADHRAREITVTIPTDKILSTATSIATAPVTVARRVLPAKGGIPLYAGLGVLALTGIIDWPVAAAAGAGFAAIRLWTRRQAKQEPQTEGAP